MYSSLHILLQRSSCVSLQSMARSMANKICRDNAHSELRIVTDACYYQIWGKYLACFTLLLRRNKGHWTNLKLPALLGMESKSISLEKVYMERQISLRNQLSRRRKGQLSIEMHIFRTILTNDRDRRKYQFEKHVQKTSIIDNYRLQ